MCPNFVGQEITNPNKMTIKKLLIKRDYATIWVNEGDKNPTKLKDQWNDNDKRIENQWKTKGQK